MSTVRIPMMLVAGFSAATLGCDSTASDEQRQLDVLVAGATQPSVTSVLAEQQRRFAAALSDPAGDPTPYMSTRFEVVDWDDAATQPKQAPGGRMVTGLDYLSTLADRIPASFAEPKSVTVQMEGPDHGVAISILANGSSTVTHWFRAADGWKSSLLILNVPDDAIDRMRRS